MNNPESTLAPKPDPNTQPVSDSVDRIVRHIPEVGDYVLATKYGDGDPQDHWCIGFYDGLTNAMKYDHPRYDVLDGDGKNFRGNGFRRIKKITHERGSWMLNHAKEIELSGKSVWHFARCSMSCLPNAPITDGELK